jgi:hypothetical protein
MGGNRTGNQVGAEVELRTQEDEHEEQRKNASSMEALLHFI